MTAGLPSSATSSRPTIKEKTLFRNDRFLLAIVISIAVLVVASVAVVLTRSTTEEYTDDTSPAGVVTNYVLALQRSETDTAFSYLADLPGRPSRSQFRLHRRDSYNHSRNVSVRIVETIIDGNEAEVQLVVISTSSGPFLIEQIHERPEVALLVREEGGWRLIQMPYEFWSYEWYRDQGLPEPPKPAPSSHVP